MNILTTLLRSKGCSSEMIKFAMERKSLLHDSLCKGDINKFIDIMSRAFEASEDEYVSTIYLNGFDDQESLRRTEWEYNGDVLDYYGYTFCNENIRW